MTSDTTHKLLLTIATAAVAIAAQQAVTAFAGYLIITRGKTCTVGDRIKMGGVRRDVVSLGFLQTRILEIGLQELHMPAPYRADRQRAEAILLDAARRATESISRVAPITIERPRGRGGSA